MMGVSPHWPLWTDRDEVIRFLEGALKDYDIGPSPTNPNISPVIYRAAKSALEYLLAYKELL